MAATMRALRVKASAATALPQQYKSVTPYGDRLLVKTGGAETESAGGILLPTSAAQKDNKGTVVQVGAGAPGKDGKAVPVGIKAGATVMYSQFAGTEVEFEGDEHVLLKEADVIGTLADADDDASLQPTDDRVLIKVSEAAEKTDAGLILTGDALEKPSTGDVVAVGPGNRIDGDKRAGSSLKVGQQVLYSKFAGTEITGKDDVEYIVVREADVIAVLA
eukprot:PRCOL_00005756-RA